MEEHMQLQCYLRANEELRDVSGPATPVLSRGNVQAAA